MTVEVWLGMYKVIEEMGELGQVFGKLGPFPDGVHPDKKGPLQDRLQEEIADLQAALTYFTTVNELDVDFIRSRMNAKLTKFHNWGLTGVQLNEPL